MARGDQHSLALRLTRKYVGTYQHEDEWNNIGTATEKLSGIDDHADDDDPCEPVTQLYCFEVKTDEPQEPKTIEQAFRDTFTKWGCAHEYDCCGCRSYRVSRVAPCGNDEWLVTVSSARNY